MSIAVLKNATVVPEGSASEVLPMLPQTVVNIRKENHVPRNQQPSKEQFECGRIGKISLEDEKMEDEEYELDLEETGSDDEENF